MIEANSVAAKISIIVPTYNRAHLLKRAMDSIYAQSLLPMETIVVDDGSSDATARLIQRSYPQARYLYQRHAGVSVARNYGASIARGDWLAFLDSDDAWYPHKLERQTAAMATSPTLRWHHCNEQWIRNGAPLAQKKHHRKFGGDIFLPSLALCLVSPSAVLIHRQLFAEHGGFDSTLKACEDYDLWLRIACREPIGFVDEALVIKYGGHADQLSRTTPALDRYRIRTLTRLLARASLTTLQRTATVKVMEQKINILIQGARKRGHTRDVAHYEELRQNLTRA